MGISTSEIVLEYASAFRKLNINYSYDGNFDGWLTVHNENYERLKKMVRSDFHDYLPIRNEVLKLVVKQIYGIMPYSKEYILNNYRKSRDNIRYIHFPSMKKKKLIISFSGFIDYESYSRLSWFFDDKERWAGDYSYLFLGDPECYWYVGKEEEPKYQIYEQIILKTMREEGIDKSDVYCVGASMGGYAALLFSVKLNLNGAISVHAQLNRASARRYQNEIWDQKIQKCGRNFYDIADLIHSKRYAPLIYLEFGDHPSDKSGVEELISAVHDYKSTIITKKNRSIEHNTKRPSKKNIFDIIKFFDQLEK